MAIIHRTTLTPGKLELLAAWLPAQPWYADQGRAPQLARAGGFRLDDPEGEVGIEFMVATDGGGDAAIAYLVPMTYRGAALDGADEALIGTTEHGVLGRRWIYDGISDPVLLGQLDALVLGQAQPQMQGVSETPDPTVTCVPLSADGAGGGQLVVAINRVLEAEADAGVTPGRLYAGWRLPDGTTVRGCLASARYAQAG